MLQGCELIGFDTETTGTSTQRDRVVTAAVVHRAADGTMEERTWLIDPGVEIPSTATAVHGITTEQARSQGAQPELALEEIAANLAAALSQNVPLLGFNVSYDLRLLEADLARHGVTGLAARLGCEVAPLIDPLVIDRAVDRYRKGKRTLSDLMAVYGVAELDNLHDAAVDVRASIAVFDSLASSYRQIDLMSLAELHQWQRVEHGKWATRLNEFFKSKGRAADVDTTWP